MFIVSGCSALSNFNKQKILKKIQQQFPSIINVKANYQHIILEDHKLTADNMEVLEKILSYGEAVSTEILSANTSSFVVAPRIGTRTSWSSKATEILHNCGLTMINRIETSILYTLFLEDSLSAEDLQQIKLMLHDKMTEITLEDISSVEKLFTTANTATLATVPLLKNGKTAIVEINNTLALGLTENEIDYLVEQFTLLKKDPTDVELMTYAQINSEHCRHKIFNAIFTLDDKLQELSLFDMIRNTHKKIPHNTLSAYKDNAAVIRGYTIKRFYAEPDNYHYSYKLEDCHLLFKVETHNHPTAISPLEGAATGAGGEIRDEGATGQGAKPKFGLTGYSVSNLNIPDFIQPWEQQYGKPDHIASAFEIMQHAPIGSADFNNEFGRPNLLGYFRSYEQKLPESLGGNVIGYHKPIMLAGGVGVIKSEHVKKQKVMNGDQIIVLGGPAMRIGVGGGTASSNINTDVQTELDFSSVQRHNPEMERRCQEVIDQCWRMGNNNPIKFIHDVGAGGLSNAIPELLADNNLGGTIDLRSVVSEDSTMSPLELWCNEAQERYVIAIDKTNLELFKAICARERCPMAVVGSATTEPQLIVKDTNYKNDPINIPTDLLFRKTFQTNINAKTTEQQFPKLDLTQIDVNDAIYRILHLPAVASKKFLITIGDRSVTGLVARDQMVGPWQVPVADCAVSAASFNGYHGDAMSLGEKAPLAIIDAATSARMAVAEAITNIAAANIGDIEKVKLSANWMSSANSQLENGKLFTAVEAIGMEFCTALGVSIPVGKDSLSMQTKWKQQNEIKTVTSPLSVVITACSPVKDIRKTITPELNTTIKDTKLLLIDLGAGNNRLGASSLAQVYNQIFDQVPDINAIQLKNFFIVIQLLVSQDLLLAYHDRSDGGLFACVAEMAFASRIGVTINLPANDKPLASLFNEEIGAVIQVKTEDVTKVEALFAGFHMESLLHNLGHLNSNNTLEVIHNNKRFYANSITKLQQYWANTSYKMQSLRDNAECAQQEYQQIADTSDKGLFAKLTFNLDKNPITTTISMTEKPKIAILREQGVNGHIEMAAAFDKAGFQAIDVHMTDLQNGIHNLQDFTGLVACGGFSYGDVLGAGGGWAKSILFNNKLLDMFASFFNREDTFSLGVCNGCQMLAQLRSLIPGAEFWPEFTTNKSEQFEARVCMVEIISNPSILFTDMIGSQIPITIAHKQGRITELHTRQRQSLLEHSQIAMRYVDNNGRATEQYPLNPNGSLQGMTAFTSKDGRATIMMPHPERVFRTVQHSWNPEGWNESAPFMRMFYNARNWIKS